MENNKSIFFESSNFYLLYNIIKKDLNQKFNYQIDDKSKNDLFNIMNQVYIKNNHLDLKSLNMLTLKTGAPILKNICENKNNLPNNENKNNLIQNSSLNRDMLLKKKIPDFVDMRPEHLNEKTKDVNSAYNHMSERYVQKKPKSIDFSLPINSGNNRNKNFENIEEERENEIGNIGGSTKISEILKDNMSSDIIKLKNENNYDSIDNKNFDQINNATVNFENKQREMSSIIEDEVVNRENKKNLNMEISEKTVFEKNYDGNLSQMDERNSETYSIINNNENDNVEFYKQNQNISESINQDFYNYQERKSKKEDTVVNNKQFESEEKVNLLEITSFSRNWQNYPDICKLNNKSTRYDFCVNFNPAINEWVNIPIYENNIFTFLSIYPQGNLINYSESNLEIYQQIINGEDKVCNFDIKDPLIIYQEKISNKDFSDKDIVRNPFYDENKSKGEILYYVKKMISGNLGASVMNIYKNVSKIKLNSVTVPYDYLFTFLNIPINKEKTLIKSPLENPFCRVNSKDRLLNSTFNQSILSYQYLLLHIEELDGIYNSSEDIIQKCFCKITPRADWSLEDFNPDLNVSCPGRVPGFVVFTPANGEEKIFPQSALASLNKLTIKLLSPQGEIINFNRDTAIIEQICYLPYNKNDYDKRFLIIRTKNWLPCNMFLVNNIIQISNYNFLMHNEDSKIDIAVNYLSEFLNRKEGHTIINFGYIDNKKNLGVDALTIDSNKDGYINLLIIESNGYFDEENGEWNVSLGIDNKEGEELVTQEFMEYLANPETRGLNYGKLINLSMQINLSFEVTTLENKISKIESNII